MERETGRGKREDGRDSELGEEIESPSEARLPEVRRELRELLKEAGFQPVGDGKFHESRGVFLEPTSCERGVTPWISCNWIRDIDTSSVSGIAIEAFKSSALGPRYKVELTFEDGREMAGNSRSFELSPSSDFPAELRGKSLLEQLEARGAELLGRTTGGNDLYFYPATSSRMAGILLEIDSGGRLAGARQHDDGQMAGMDIISIEVARYEEDAFLLTFRDSMYETEAEISPDHVQTHRRMFRIPTPEELGVRPFDPYQECSGFTQGGVNESLMISELQTIDERDIGEVEAELRAAALLGKDVSLRDLLTEDNDSVIDAGHSHQELAWPLKVAAGVSNAEGERFMVEGREYDVRVMTCPEKYSPLTLCSSAIVYEITDRETGDSIEVWSELVDTIDRFGFYGGGEGADRLSPQRIMDFFNLAADGHF